MQGHEKQGDEVKASRALSRPAANAVALLCMALAWLLGVGWQLQQASLWHPDWVLGAVVVALGGMGVMGVMGVMGRIDLMSLTRRTRRTRLVWQWRQRWPGWMVLSLCAATLAFASTDWRASQRLADTLSSALEGQDIVVTGVVAELPRQGVTGTRFVFETESAQLRGVPVQLPSRLALGWYRSADEDVVLGGPAEDLRAGQRWRFTVRLRQPHGTLNPHGFDLELWLFEQGIGASGSVRAPSSKGAHAPPLKLTENAGHPIERLRQSLRDAIQKRVADPAAAGVLAALAIGDQAAIDREGWDLFRITGVAHLMSISGLHVTMLAWLAGALAGRLWRTQPRWLLRLPVPTVALWSGWLAAAAYSLLAGWGVPAQRTVWMIGAVVVLRALGLRWPLHAVLLAAAWLVTVMDPWALMQPGFWLSFLAVAVLVASEPVTASTPTTGHRQTASPPASLPASLQVSPTRLSRLWQTLQGGLRTQLVATVGLAPMTLIFFQQISLVGFVANLVAIPLVTLLITPLALLGTLLPPLWLVAAALVQGLGVLLKALAAAPLAVWSAGAVPGWVGACGLLAGALLVLPLPWRLRGLALPLLVPLLWPVLPRPAAGQFELLAADIGQGTAVLVRTQHHLLLFDTGPSYTTDADAGGRVLLPLLRALGEDHIDLLMLSHRDNDHVGGAATLMAGLPVRALSSSLTAEHPLLAKGVPHTRCDAGQSWAWDGVRFEVLQPQAADHAQGLKPNALSCVLRVQAQPPSARSTQGASALLTGDIEAAQEGALVQQVANRLASDVLIVPHHGSRTSSTAAFLDAVKPQVAVVQAAYRSRFGHPAPDVMARYEARGIPVVRSDRCGAWSWRSDGTAPLPACQRDAGRRYWHHQAHPPSTAP
jgi:competence protein ComEC